MLVLVGGPVGALLGLALAVGGPRGLGRLEPRAEREERERVAADLPLALDLLAACVAGGASIPGAVRAVAAAVDGPCGARLHRVAAALDLGADAAQAWSALTRPSHRPLADSHDRWSSGAPRSGGGAPDLERHGPDGPGSGGHGLDGHGFDRHGPQSAGRGGGGPGPAGTGWRGGSGVPGVLGRGGPRSAPASGRAASRGADGPGDELAASAARVLARAGDGGAPVGAAVARLAAEARQQSRARGEQAAQRAGVLAVAPLGLCFLPAFVLLGVVPVIVGLIGPLLSSF